MLPIRKQAKQTSRRNELCTMDIMIGRYSRGRGDLTSNVSFSREHLGKEDRKRDLMLRTDLVILEKEM